MNVLKLLLPTVVVAMGMTALPVHAIELSDVVNSISGSRDSDRDSDWDRGRDRDRDSDNYSWRTYHGSVPRDAISGGREASRTLYICQARYMDGTHPGKLVDGRCNITWGGAEVQQKHFRVLVGDGLRWRLVRGDRIPSAAIAGGNERGQPLYICQARYSGGIHPGKVFDNSCHIGYNGRDIARQEFRVLVPGRGSNDWSEFDDRNDDDGIGSRPGSSMGAGAPAMGAKPPAAK
ncbi:hypothetical protein BH10PSE19_BH10PSE19_03090 [soil metagenome]